MERTEQPTQPAPQGGTLLHASRRGELTFVLLFLAAIVLLSLGNGKLFPFDPPSFFVASVQQYCQYTITDPQGRPLLLHEFGLGDFYMAQAGDMARMPEQEPGAIKLPATISIFGNVSSRDEVVVVVQQALRTRPAPVYVTVSQRVIGPIDLQKVGVVAVHRWRISRSVVVTER